MIIFARKIARDSTQQGVQIMPRPLEQIILDARRAGLKFNAPADEAAIADLESQAGIRIPQDYREFLLRMADGGVKPCRLVPLSRWNDSYWIDEPTPKMLAAPCVLTPECADHGSQWLDKLNVADWQRRWDSGEWCPTFGTMAIAEIGCGLFYSMVMTGPHRGRVFSWGDHASNPPLFQPENSFSDWFGGCLDLMLSGKPVHFLDGRLP
jgi:hypothetical protein